MNPCDCGHERSAHANRLWECRWCDCKGFTPASIPDIFDELETPSCEAADVLENLPDGPD